ncbi:putative glucuronosyltransferase PGSIP8 [Diplonema papillatum]|nr:putative glucuronosyltransferase PGSIP8 [Diplonema papillatum]
MKLPLAVATALLVSARADAQPPVTAPAGGSRFAWTTIYYEAGRNDDEYYLAARVLMQSVKDSQTVADRVILIAEGTQSRYADGFKQDGCQLKWIGNIESPWGHATQQRFAFSLNKLKIWSMTEYDRVIFLDADVVVLQHADFLFRCGRFCAVFFNPIHFHTAILIVKPDQLVYNDMLKKLHTGDLGSYDGADQGFINAYFKGLNAANEWTKDKPASDEPMNRLPVQYNMHHIYYYEKMSWGGPWGSVDDHVTMTYPITAAGKPWFWWGYPIMDMHWVWLAYRNRVETLGEHPMPIVLLVLAPALHFALAEGLKRYQTTRQVSVDTMAPETSDRAGIWFVWGRSSCKATLIGIMLACGSLMVARLATPGIVHPYVAWPTFLTYYTLSFYHSACFLWKRILGTKLRVEPVHWALLAAPWILYFAAGSYPYYPHGLIKLVCFVIAMLASAACNVALYKAVFDSNLKLR